MVYDFRLSVIYKFNSTYIFIDKLLYTIRVRMEDYMEVKKDIKSDDKKSSILLENRKKLSLTGVAEVVNFNDKQIMLNTSAGGLNIKGEELKMTKLDVQNGDVAIIGKINSFAYTGSEVKQDNESIIAKLFK